MTIERRIIEARIRKGLTQDGLAHKAGVSLRTVARLEHGWYKRNDVTPTLRSLILVGDALDISVDELLELAAAA